MKNILREKSFEFSKEIIGIVINLSKIRNFNPIIEQLLKSGTSIGANITESIYSQSRADFIAKLSIAYKETGETLY